MLALQEENSTAVAVQNQTQNMHISSKINDVGEVKQCIIYVLFSIEYMLIKKRISKF